MLALTRRMEDHLHGRDPVTVSVVVTTTVILLLGEILPKGFSVHWPARAALFFVPILAPLLRVIAPASRVLERVGMEVLRILGVPREVRTHLEWGELQLMFEDLQGKGLSEREGVLASNVFSFFETRAYEIMTPRVDLVAVPVDAPLEEIRRRVIRGRHSRIPVYRGSVDHIIGFLNAKEILLEETYRPEAMLHAVHYVPERARLHRILAEVQSRRLSLVVVVNEYGGTSGIITQEDLVEEVVGEIFDEQDHDELPDIEPVSDWSWKVAGLLLMEDLAEEMGVPLAESPAETVAGHVAHLLGRLPRSGDTVSEGPVTYRVLQVRRHRAQRVEVVLTPPIRGETPR
jgi:CBS domain containing-hemolysin-like protein